MAPACQQYRQDDAARLMPDRLAMSPPIGLTTSQPDAITASPSAYRRILALVVSPGNRQGLPKTALQTADQQWRRTGGKQPPPRQNADSLATRSRPLPKLRKGLRPQAEESSGPA
jgi:hypothetical protein